MRLYISRPPFPATPVKAKLQPQQMMERQARNYLDLDQSSTTWLTEHESCTSEAVAAVLELLSEKIGW
jgi:hypothetical protein